MFRRPSARKRRSQGLSPALAPASGSTLLRSPRGRSRPKPSRHVRSTPSAGGSAVGFPCRSLERLRFVQPKDLSYRTHRAPAGLSGPSRWLVAPLSMSPLPLAEAVCTSSSSGAGQAPSRHPGLEIPEYFPTVKSSNPERVPRRSDELKVLPVGRFGKLASPPLSTIPKFHCGRRWISLHFIATVLRAIICHAWQAGATEAH